MALYLHSFSHLCGVVHIKYRDNFILYCHFLYFLTDKFLCWLLITIMHLCLCMLQDKERVTKRFLEAAEKGITVRKASLSCQDLVRHLSKSGPIILLIDASRLHCDICKVNKLTSELRGCLPWSASFTGIYEHKVAASSVSAALINMSCIFRLRNLLLMSET